MRYGRKFMKRPSPSLEELIRAREVRYVCELDGNRYDLADEGTDEQGVFAHCEQCGRVLPPREVSSLMADAHQRQQPRCQRRYLYRSKRWGQRCTAPATVVSRAPYDDLLVCGVHARGWIPRVRYPLGKVLAS